MKTINKHQLNFKTKIFLLRRNYWILIFVVWTSLLQTALANRAQPVVERSVPISDGRSYYIWVPKPKGSIRMDSIWFMTTKPGTELNMKAKLCSSCKLSAIVGKTSFYEIKQPNEWHKLQVKYTANYGASTVVIDSQYFHPRGQSKEQSPMHLVFNSTSDLYWTLLNPKDEPFLQLSSAECSSSSSSSSKTGTFMKLSTEGGFELDLVTMVSLGGNILLLILLVVIICYYKQKVRTEVNLRKARGDPNKITYRQTLDPANFISTPIQTDAESHTTEHTNFPDEGYQWGSQQQDNSYPNAVTHHYMGQENKDYQE
ncbi:unnamed protein product [Meganyctiphanes norvegica]|uniref:Uncharacterized protein n=1 Tax=Meganyctiphanes norvegica TaxID=48144 RepID=A0AAV2S5B5_MEGNR